MFVSFRKRLVGYFSGDAVSRHRDYSFKEGFLFIVNREIIFEKIDAILQRQNYQSFDKYYSLVAVSFERSFQWRRFLLMNH
jgi:hypothetical protein